MIPRNASPIGHVSPRPPIDLNYRHPGPANVEPDDYQPLSAAECARIWKLVRQAAEGSNVGAVPEPDVCTDGWEVA
jgi:hypothetical protein